MDAAIVQYVAEAIAAEWMGGKERSRGILHGKLEMRYQYNICNNAQHKSPINDETYF